MPSDKSCLGVCSLRTGALIILYIPVVVCVLLFGFSIGVLSSMSGKMIDFSSIMMIVLIFALPLGIPTTAIYGVMKKKPSFMIPYLAFVLVSLVSVVFLMVIIAFRAFSAAVLINFCITMRIDTTDMKEYDILPNGTAEIFCLLLALDVLQYYLFVVVLSYYHKLRREIKQTEQTGAKVFSERVKANTVQCICSTTVSYNIANKHVTRSAEKKVSKLHPRITFLKSVCLFALVKFFILMIYIAYFFILKNNKYLIDFELEKKSMYLL